MIISHFESMFATVSEEIRCEHEAIRRGMGWWGHARAYRNQLFLMRMGGGAGIFSGQNSINSVTFSGGTGNSDQKPRKGIGFS